MKKAFGMTKFHGIHKGLDAAIVKATNYKHALPKEKHIRTIFQSLSPSKPRSEVIYCLHGLVKRMSQTNNWAVAVKSLIVIHRAMRELDTSIWIAMVNYSIKYSEKHDTTELLEQLPALQNLLFRILDCKVVGESVKLYVAITIRVVELLDKFFEMLQADASRALQIYKKSISQAERLSELFETCKGLEFGRGQKFINIKKPPTSFMITMEEYIKEAPSTLMLEYNMDANNEGVSSTKVETLESDLLSIGNDGANDISKSTNSFPDNNITMPTQEAAELMGLYDLLTGASEFDENSLALAIVPTENCTENSQSSSNDERGESTITGWEFALFTEPEVYNDNLPETENKEDGGMEMVSPDNIYNEAIIGTQQSSTNQFGQVTSNPFDFDISDDKFNMTSPIPTQILSTPYENYYMMWQQQHQQQHEPFVLNKKSTNPFDEPSILAPSMPTHSTESS
ncbi:hypothetical protein RJT34_15193 [Clitoria ternatea]|uniref:ENTH domain-containing protein n=1 Tax=Clitoria ternatea TaxID=43366 RepID=A0AAN9PNM4_CLITE